MAVSVYVLLNGRIRATLWAYTCCKWCIRGASGVNTWCVEVSIYMLLLGIYVLHFSVYVCCS